MAMEGQLEVNWRAIGGWEIKDFFVYIDGHLQVTVVLIPCLLGTQGLKEATTGIICCLFCVALRSVA